MSSRVPLCSPFLPLTSWDSQPDALALLAAWRAAAINPTVTAPLEALFAEIAATITARAPACWASGRCCHFEAHGHRLYVTGLEVAYTLARLPVTPLPSSSKAFSGTMSLPLALGHQESGGNRRTTPITTSPAPDCAFQAANLCTIHTIKPLACRVYFCDESAQSWQHDLMERLMSSLRALHDAHDIPYRYMEWRAALALFGHAAESPPPTLTPRAAVDSDPRA